jgi:hypothetical protein
MADQAKDKEATPAVVSPPTTPAVPPARKAAAARAKAPERAPDAILRDIAAERTQLAKAFDDLRGDLGKAIDAGSNRATEVGRQAILVVPVMAVAVTATFGGLVGGALALRRRHRRK